MHEWGGETGLLATSSPPHGLVQTEFGRFPALQIFTLAELFADRHPRLPPLVSPNRKAPRGETRQSHQPGAQAALQLE